MKHTHPLSPGTLLRPWERVQLDRLLHQGEAPVRLIRRAQALSLLDQGKSPTAIAEFLGMSRMTPYRVEDKYRNGGLEEALVEPSRPSHNRALDEHQAAQVLALVCSPPPPGRARWTVRLATSEALKRGIVEKVSREPIRKLLHQGGLKPWREKNVVHPGFKRLLRGQDGGRAGGVRTAPEPQRASGMPG